MGSPVSVVVAKIVMQNIEEQALATYTSLVTLRWRHEHLDRQSADIEFTKEIEENGDVNNHIAEHHL